MRERAREEAARRILTPEMQEVLIRKAEDLLSRLIDRYVPVPGSHPVTPPSSAPNPFHVLGLKAGCSAADVKRRVRDLARVFHPDLAGGDGQKMAEINVAAQQILAELGEAR